MRLLIISHTAHYDHAGTVVGWGPTVREIDHLTRLFDEVIHVAPLHDEPPPNSSLPYTSGRVTLRPVRPAGGTGLGAKLGILSHLPEFLHAIQDECRTADAVHVRCPANISLIAAVLLAFKRWPRARWIKYAGNWNPTGPEAWSYTFQRWWLRLGWHQGLVTVNGRWRDQPAHVRSFLNPCLTPEELADAASIARDKQLDRPLRLLFVGALNRAKGVARALEIFARIRAGGLDSTLEFVGDGPNRPEFESLAHSLGVADAVTFHGWLPRPELGPIYGRAHVLLFPSSSEGWPKVLSEAMAHGVVPVASAVSSIPQILDETGSGIAIAPEDIDQFASSILDLAADVDRWTRFSLSAMDAATSFSYEAYLEAVDQLFQEMGLQELAPAT